MEPDGIAPRPLPPPPPRSLLQPASPSPSSTPNPLLVPHSPSRSMRPSISANRPRIPRELTDALDGEAITSHLPSLEALGPQQLRYLTHLLSSKLETERRSHRTDKESLSRQLDEARERAAQLQQRLEKALLPKTTSDAGVETREGPGGHENIHTVHDTLVRMGRNIEVITMQVEDLADRTEDVQSTALAAFNKKHRKPRRRRVRRRTRALDLDMEITDGLPVVETRSQWRAILLKGYNQEDLHAILGKSLLRLHELRQQEQKPRDLLRRVREAVTQVNEPPATALIREAVAHPLIKLETLESEIGLNTLCDLVDGIEFGAGCMRKWGAMFLYLARILSCEPDRLPKGFTMSRIHFSSSFAPLLKAPLHFLILLSSCGGYQRRHSAGILLRKVVQHINAVWDETPSRLPEGQEVAVLLKPTEEFLDQGPVGLGHVLSGDGPYTVELMDEDDEVTVSAGHIRPASLVKIGDTPEPELAARLGTLHSALVREVESGDESSIPSLDVDTAVTRYCWLCSASEQSELCLDGTSHKEELLPIASCTPLALAVRLRLAAAVEEMLKGGVVSGPDLTGSTSCIRDEQQVKRTLTERFQCHHYIDYWKTADNGHGTPVLHELLLGLPPLMGSAGFPIASKPPITAKATFWPVNTMRCDVSKFQEGVSLTERLVGEQIVSMLLSAITTDRKIVVRGQPATEIFSDHRSNISFASLAMRLMSRRLERITKLYDRCGLFRPLSRSIPLLGVTLTVQSVPSLIPMLFDLGVFELAPYDSVGGLDAAITAGGAILVQYRHLWSQTRVGHELLVYDSGLSLAHWLCLYNLEKHLKEWIDFTSKAVDVLAAHTQWLGWSPLHFAVYGNAIECINLIFNTARRSGQILAVTNDQARPKMLHSHPTRFLSRADLAKVGEDRERLSDPADVGDPARYGVVGPTGQTPIHVACMFGLPDCVRALLNANAIPTLRMEPEGLDAHDVSAAVETRMVFQKERAGKRGVGSRLWTKSNADTLSVLHQNLVVLNASQYVQKKLRRFAIRSVWGKILPHLVLCVLLVLVYWRYISNNDTFTIGNAMANSIADEMFVPGDYIYNDPMSYTMVSRRNLETVGELEELEAWVKGIFFRQVLDSEGVVADFFHIVGSIHLAMAVESPAPCGEDDWGICSHKFGVLEEREGWPRSGGEILGTTSRDVGRRTLLPGSTWSYIPNPPPDPSLAWDFPRNDSAASRKLVESLSFEGMRGMNIWLTTYNPSIGSFATVFVTFAAPRQGLVYPFFQVIPFNYPFPMLDTVHDTVISLACFLYMLLYAMYYTIEEGLDLYFVTLTTVKRNREARDMHKELNQSNMLYKAQNLVRSFMRYLTVDWNTLDILTVVLLYMVIDCEYVLYLLYKETDEEIQEKGGLTVPDAFYNSFVPLSLYLQYERFLFASLIGVSFIKLLKFATLIPMVGPVVNAIVRTCLSPRVAIFCFVFFYLLLCLAAVYAIVFSLQEDQRSYSVSLLNIFIGVLGDLGVPESRSLYAQLLHIVVGVTTQLVMVNLFIAVISVDYERNLDAASANWSTQVVDIYKEDRLRLINMDRASGFIRLHRMGRGCRWRCCRQYLLQLGYPISDQVHLYDTDPEAYCYMRDWAVVESSVVRAYMHSFREKVQEDEESASRKMIAHEEVADNVSSIDSENEQPGPSPLAMTTRLGATVTIPATRQPSTRPGTWFNNPTPNVPLDKFALRSSRKTSDLETPLLKKESDRER